MSEPSIEDIVAQQQALKVMEAQNALPHLNAALEAISKADVTALATLCADRAPLVADAAAKQRLTNIAIVLSNGVSTITRLRDQAQAVVDAQAAPAT